MIRSEQGGEPDLLVSFIEQAVSRLAAEDYAAFVGMFDQSRLSAEDVVLALRFLDEERPVTKIDDPLAAGPGRGCADLAAFRDGGGYRLDYDLSTGGERNDLTVSCEFRRADGGCRARLLDLRTL